MSNLPAVVLWHAAEMDVVIREPTPADAEAVGRMHWASWREAYAALLPPDFFSEDGERGRIERWRRNLAEPRFGVTSRIALRGDEVVGLASAGPSRDNETAGPAVTERELWALYVRAAEYGTGLASRLLDAVLPPGPAELWVFEANPRARAFYATRGFVPDGARHVFGADLNHQPEIRMVRVPAASTAPRQPEL